MVGWSTDPEEEAEQKTASYDGARGCDKASGCQSLYRSGPDKLPSLLLSLMQNSEFTLNPPSRRGTRSSPLGAGLWVASSWSGVPAVQLGM